MCRSGAGAIVIDQSLAALVTGLLRVDRSATQMTGAECDPAGSSNDRDTPPLSQSFPRRSETWSRRIPGGSP